MGETETEPPRPMIVGPDSGPEAPFPLLMEGDVISGFGRGSKELGIPTANLPVDAAATPWIADVKSGVYFGWAALALPPDHPDHHADRRPRKEEGSAAAAQANGTATSSPSSSSAPPPTSSGPSSSSSDAPSEEFTLFPMVMSIGYNPFYKNTVRSAEVHVLHDFARDFYGARLRLAVLGFVREERDYAGLDALVADIRLDCEVARRSLLGRPAWRPRQLPGEGGMRGELDCAWLVRKREEA